MPPPEKPRREPDRPLRASKTEPQRIAKLLARAGVASRREIERMIEARRVAIDGVAIETPATIVTSLHNVTVDGEPVAALEACRHLIDTLKEQVPIWKEQALTDGTSEWVGLGEGSGA